MSKVKTEFEDKICKTFKGTQIPNSIRIIDEGDNVKIELNGKMIIEDNMQVVGNAFEGWAIVAHVCSNKEVYLEVDDYSMFPHGEYKYIGHGHFSRFLYRAMKFTEQYEWCRLTEKLDEEVNSFKEFICSDKNIFTNNIPTKEAEETERLSDENSIEAKLAEDGVLKAVLSKKLDIGDDPVYRQLPVGLFYGEKSKKRLFLPMVIQLSICGIKMKKQ